MNATSWRSSREYLDAVRAEWSKLRTAPGMLWLLPAVIALTITLGVAVVATTATCVSGGCTVDPAKVSLTGVDLGQAIVAVFAVLSIGAEYSTGMIRITFAAVPRRGRVLLAKAAVLAGLVAATTTPAVLASLLAGRLILPGRGYTTAHGYPAMSLYDGPTVRAAAGSILYLLLVTMLSLGVATAVRDSASAIGIVLGVLYLFPIIIGSVSDATWRRHLEQIAPMTAGLAIQRTMRLESLPIGGWAGLGVLAIWATGALAIGGLLLHRRDA
jgi:ABC-2 type transport system permease protein